MKIQVLSVQITTTPTQKGSYQTADIAFKNLTYQGKIEGKKIVSFGVTKASFEVLATAQPNDIYDVEVKKNEKNYNDWVSMTKGTVDGAAAPQQTTAGHPPAGNATARTSTYETPEERAKKQVYIIRQSSLSNAIDTLAVGSKSALKADEVIDLARKYESYVFGTQLELPFPKEEFPDMPQ